MSKLETPLTRAYWQQIGGTLIEEFPLIARRAGVAPRWADALILPNGKHRIAHASEVSIEGEDVILVQTKAKRLGMYLMGQAIFSRELLLRYHRPASVRSIALCTQDDAVLRPMLEAYPGVEIVVVSPEQDSVAS